MFSSSCLAVSVINFWLLCQQVSNTEVNNNNNNNNINNYFCVLIEGNLKFCGTEFLPRLYSNWGGQQINGLSLLLQKE